MIEMSNLNDQQLEAVLHQDGPCLVLASAGSGKTRVLTHRLARLIDESQDPARILAATFTRRAADTMRERLAGLVGEELARPVWIGTFHGTCLRMLKISYAELELPAFGVMPPHLALRLARDILAAPDSRHPYGMNWSMEPMSVLRQISRAKADLVDVDGAEAFFREHTELDGSINQHVEFWRRYEDAKAHPNRWVPVNQQRPPRYLDFDDFMLRTHQLLSRNAEALKRWQDSFDYVLEDEVQDTMIAQHEIIRLLTARHRNYFATGDVEQSVYSFRGSRPDYTVMTFERDFPGGRIIKLPANYRSQASIVEAAGRLIRHNGTPAAYSLEPVAMRPADSLPEVIITPDEDSEAVELARRISAEVWPLGNRRYRDCAVLYRTNAQSRALEDAMMRAQVPYIVNGSSGFYDRRDVKDALSFLQLAHNANCDAGDDALRRIVNIPSRWYGRESHCLGKAFVTKLESVARQTRQSLWAALDCGSWTTWQWEAIADIRRWVGYVTDAGPAPAAMLDLVRAGGYDAYLMGEVGAQEEDDTDVFEGLVELVHAAGNFENAAAFLDHVTQQRSRAKRLRKDEDAVQLLTLHRAKGLEWPFVLIAGCSLGLLPHKRSIEYLDTNQQHIAPESIEEERRLAYVGVTRAMDDLVISSLSSYQGNELKVSPFLSELGLLEDVAEEEAVEELW